MDTSLRTVRTCGIIWTNWSKRENSSISWITQMARGENKNKTPERWFFKTSLGNNKCHLCCPRENQLLPSRVMFVTRLPAEDITSRPKKARVDIQPVLGFSDEDKIWIIQPHDDALVITLRIEGYDMKRVLVDQGNGVEIMYPDLYKGLNLKPENLIANVSPLVSFYGKTVVLKGQIRLPV